MAKELLEVVVDQKPGIINWNFEQLKTALAEKMKEYEGLVYTEETVPVAKADVATLRKLKKSVSDKRIEIKNKCLEPYEIIEAQAAELTKLIDKPITEIAAQLDEYEKQRKTAVRKEITAFMEKTFASLPADIAKSLQVKIYDDKWENASTTKKTWKEAIGQALKVTEDDLAVLNDLEEDIREGALMKYREHLVLSEAMLKAEELRKQKAVILEKERARILAEEQLKAQQAEWKAKQEAQIAQKPFSKPIEAAEMEHLTITNTNMISVPVGPEEVETEPVSGWVEGAINPPVEEKEIYTLRISATHSQIAKIKAYIEYTGAVYREA